jgi:predicted branched-subunit amino acid permease
MPLNDLLEKNLSPFESYLLGFKKGSPILMGIFPFALIYGAAANSAGLSFIQTVAMSLTIFAGSSQLVFINLWESGINVVALALTVATVNLRLLIYGSSLVPHVGPAPNIINGLIRGYFLTDESYSISMAHFIRGGGEKKAIPVFFYLGAAGPTYFGWQLVGPIGYLLGTFLPQSLPFSMAIPMVFLALLISVLTASKKRRNPKIVAAIASGLYAIVLKNALPPGIGIILAIFIGMGVGLLVLHFVQDQDKDNMEKTIEDPLDNSHKDNIENHGLDTPDKSNPEGEA